MPNVVLSDAGVRVVDEAGVAFGGPLLHPAAIKATRATAISGPIGVDLFLHTREGATPGAGCGTEEATIDRGGCACDR